jgi:fucose 4-O-acetylase-like acetyltransferase
MLPFFVLGWAIKQRGLPPWAARRSWSSLPGRAAAVALLAGTFAAAYLNVDAVRELRLRQWAQMNHNYAELGMPEWWAGFVRLGQLGLAVLLIAAVLVLVPRGRNRTSEWGQATMYVYMLHLFPIYLLWQTDFFFAWFDSAASFAALIALAVCWTIVLSTQPVRRLFRPLVEPRLDRLLVPEARSGRRARA